MAQLSERIDLFLQSVFILHCVGTVNDEHATTLSIVRLVEAACILQCGDSLWVSFDLIITPTDPVMSICSSILTKIREAHEQLLISANHICVILILFSNPCAVLPCKSCQLVFWKTLNQQIKIFKCRNTVTERKK